MLFLHYCQTVFLVALRQSISWAQFIIAIIIIIVGCVIWLAAAFGMAIDTSDLVAIVRTPKFYVMLLGVVIVVRLVFAQYWMWGEEHDSRIRAQEQLTELSGPVITPAQERLLVLIAKYQGQFVANKIIIGRKGNLHFPGQPDKGKGINLIVDLYDGDSPTTRQNFEALMDSIPLEYLRVFAEMRWNSPFVVSVTDRGMS